VIPRGIDIAAFTPEAVSRDRVEDIRKQWGLKAGKPVILLPGRLTRWKGQLGFVEALAKLPNQEFEAVLAGDPQEREGYLAELREAIDRVKLTQKIRIPGHCTDMPAALMAADLVVAPSIEPEAFGRVAVEAQAMGRPIVASRLGAQTETVVDGQTGFLFEPGNVEELAQRMTAALSLTSQQRTDMARVQRERVVSSYTVDAMCAATLRVYQDVVTSGRSDQNPV
jgi:glycosyltransferase involved in cell wall biosynthesis